MSDGTGAVGFVFGTIGLLFGLGGVAMAFFLVRSRVVRSRILATGVTVEARCLDTYSSSSGENSSTRHAVLSFTTRDGREIRIQPAVVAPIVAGDFVAVRYAPERPEKAVLVDPGASRAANGCGMVLGLAVCAVFAGVGLLFAVSGYGLFDFLSSTPDPNVYVPDPTFTP